MSKDRNNKKGFTLAEVLITLTIIGVVAALTIPSLLANVSDKTYDAKRKGFATRMAQAISQMDALNSYEAKIPEGYTGSATATEYSKENSSMNFVTEGLSKVYKISNICDFENFAACDFPKTFKRWYESTVLTTINYPYGFVSLFNQENDIVQLQTKAVAVRTKNGESFLLWYYPRCISEQDVAEGKEKYWTKEVCVAFIVDLDGARKGPNSVSRDIHSGVILYPDTPYLVLPKTAILGSGTKLPSYDDDFTKTAAYDCENRSGQGVPTHGWTLPSRENYFAHAIFGHLRHDVWTSTVTGAGADDYGWMIDYHVARLAPRTEKSKDGYCVVKDSN